MNFRLGQSCKETQRLGAYFKKGQDIPTESHIEQAGLGGVCQPGCIAQEASRNNIIAAAKEHTFTDGQCKS